MPVSRPDQCCCPECLQGIDHPDGNYHREMRAFLSEFAERGCPVIPVLLPEAAVPELPIFLRGMTWVDLRDQDGDGMERLIWGITGRRPDEPR